MARSRVSEQRIEIEDAAFAPRYDTEETDSGQTVAPMVNVVDVGRQA
jgi:hypothetical protein